MEKKITNNTASAGVGASGTKEDINGCLVDFHSHILPEMDDGSKSLEESLKMVSMSAGQGVCCIALTPHFYPTDEDPEKFLCRRLRSYRTLRDAVETRYPLLVEGAEVQYFDGIAQMEELPLLRIGNSDLLLIEMPFMRWTTRMIDEILNINYREGYQVVLAHIERYIADQKKDTLELFEDCGVMMQSNAAFFTARSTRRKAMKMLQEGVISFIGSDSHNTTTRLPNVGDAAKFISDSLGEDFIRNMSLKNLKLIYGK